jgi:hypothetical protein
MYSMYSCSTGTHACTAYGIKCRSKFSTTKVSTTGYQGVPPDTARSALNLDLATKFSTLVQPTLQSPSRPGRVLYLWAMENSGR